jgi:hypothetical protein
VTESQVEYVQVGTLRKVVTESPSRVGNDTHDSGRSPVVDSVCSSDEYRPCNAESSR